MFVPRNRVMNKCHNFLWLKFFEEVLIVIDATWSVLFNHTIMYVYARSLIFRDFLLDLSLTNLLIFACTMYCIAEQYVKHAFHLVQ